MKSALHGSEIAYAVIFAVAGAWSLVSIARMYGWRFWKWPWGVWFRRRPPN